ncbi:MAG: hypothetical protein IKN04_03080 [Clostridia bacterium]|nr:hypothetical protein [Clostridia bacterium]
MATKNTKTRKPLTSGAKGLICLAILLALTIFISCLSITGMNLDAEGVNVLLPWVPVSSANWPASLPVSRALGGGTYVEYSYTLAEDAADNALNDSVNIIRERLVQMGEADADVSVKDGAVRIELRKMDASRLASLRNMAIMGGQFEFTDTNSNVILTEKDISRAEVKVNYNNARTSYTVSLVFSVNKDGQTKLAETNPSYLSVTCDGDSVSSYAIVSGDTVTCSLGSNNTAYNTGANLAFLVNTGAVDMTLVLRDSGMTDASMGSVQNVVLIVFALLLLCTLVYMVITGKLTGIAGFLSVWCAVVLNLFFVAAIVVPSVYMLNVGCLIAVLLGVLVAMYAAVTRTDAISKQISEGSAPKAASKLGFKAAAKNIWIAHGAVLVVALILMIFSFSKSTGYTLASGVVASAMTTVVMRAFQFCFTMITNKPSLFGKAK